MQDAIIKALQVYRASPKLDDEEIFNCLVAEGIERHMAARLVEFLPLAYFRTLLAESGAKVSESYQRMDHKGKISPERPLASEPLWCEIVAYAKAETSQGISKHDFFAVASRSAEYHVVNELLGKGSTPDKIGLTPPLFIWPEEGPEITLHESEPQDNQTSHDKKKWWQFWQ